MKVEITGLNLKYEGLVNRFERTFLSKDVETAQPHIRAAIERVATFAPCPACGGARLNQAALGATIDGRNIAECAAMQVDDLARVRRRHRRARRSRPALDALRHTLDSLVEIGLGYLSLDRESATLSGGEAQRVKMVRHLGSSLTDITYVFDEPTVGLHPHDVQRINELLLRAARQGQHGARRRARAARSSRSPTTWSTWGRARARTAGPSSTRATSPACAPRGRSPAGTLDRAQTLKETVREPARRAADRARDAAQPAGRDGRRPARRADRRSPASPGRARARSIHGCLAQQHDEVTVLDQTPIRGSRRSNPATYTGMLDPIRKAFAKANGVKPALFSANSEGACPECKGIGLIYTDLAFMAGVVSVCEACEGKRFTAEVLEYQLRGKDISEVLAMSVDEAAEFFTEKAVRPMLGGAGRRRASATSAGPAAHHAVGRRAPAAQAGDRDDGAAEVSCSTSRRPACTWTTSTS